MKKLLIAAILTAFAAAPALAQPESVTLEAKNGNVTFSHKTHAEKFECSKCHEGTPGKMELDKNKAHELCKGCHQENNAGPTKCSECHKK